MPVFLNTRGRTKISIAICARCSQKFPYTELMADPNYPGLYVCKDDLDQFDPYRLPARPTEDITLDHPRPDVSLAPGPWSTWTDMPQAVINAQTNNDVSTEDLGGLIAVAPPVTVQQQPAAWEPNREYPLGYTVTPENPVGLDAAGTQIWMFTAMVPGRSGGTAPDWTTSTGTEVNDFQVVWCNSGLFMP